MGLAEHQVSRGAAILLVSLVAAACFGGDDPGYRVVVENKTATVFILVMEGVGFALPELEGTPRRAFSVPAGATSIASPWVYVGWDTTGAQKWGHMTLLTSDCQVIAEFKEPAGTYALSIATDEVAIDLYQESQIPEGTAELAFASHDCP